MAAVTADQVNSFLRELGDFPGQGDMFVEAVDDDGVRVRWFYDETKLRPGGIISGPTLFTVADVAGWILSFLQNGIEPMAMTWDLHITFLRPAIGGDIIAESKVRKLGRTLVYGDVTMHVDGQPGKPVAHATVTYALPKRSGSVDG